MRYFVLFYEVVDDFIARRSLYRGDHLAHVRDAQQRGQLLMAGALEEPADRALLVFRAPDRSVVEDFARSDPYVTNGLVTHWEARSWANVLTDDFSGSEIASGGQ